MITVVLATMSKLYYKYYLGDGEKTDHMYCKTCISYLFFYKGASKRWGDSFMGRRQAETAHIQGGWDVYRLYPESSAGCWGRESGLSCWGPYLPPGLHPTPEPAVFLHWKVRQHHLRRQSHPQGRQEVRTQHVDHKWTFPGSAAPGSEPWPQSSRTRQCHQGGEVFWGPHVLHLRECESLSLNKYPLQNKTIK